jgi:nucleotide-binding universal stress UspA family protein
MYATVLVPVSLDQETTAEAACAVARALRNPGARMVLLHVMEEIPGYAQTYLPEGTQDRLCRDAEAALRRIGGEEAEVIVTSGHPSRTILDTAEREAADCIVIASHDPGLPDYFLGSTATQVVRHAHCSVHVLR